MNDITTVHYYSLWNLEVLLLRLTQLEGGGGMEKWVVLERQEGCEEQCGPRKNLRGKDVTAGWGNGRPSLHQSMKTRLSQTP